MNFLLNPLYTYNFSTGEFGIQTSAFSYTTLLLVFLTYGMETALFRFSQTEIDKDKVYSTAMISVSVSSVIFVFITCMFALPISDFIRFTGHPEYVTWFAIIVGADVISAVALAKLRQQNKAKRFAVISSIKIFTLIAFNLFFIVFCKHVYEAPESFFKPFVNLVYNPKIGIGYVFISTLIASLLNLLLLSNEIFKVKLIFDSPLWKKMMRYALPLLIAGLAGMINETLDRILLTRLLPKDQAMVQAGIYGACYKVSIIMTIFIQTFRYAAEPFFFSNSKEKDSKKIYADVLKYFVIICSVIFLGTMMNIHWIQYFAGSAEFRVGIKVVPILLLANMFLGVFWNQSIWYKLTGQTHYGALLTIFGAIITIVLNVYWIPRIGYMGCAWATLICYASMMIASYFMGNKHYPVNYDLKRILGYLGLSLTLFFISLYIKTGSPAINLILNNLMLIGFIAFAWKMEKKNLVKLT